MGLLDGLFGGRAQAGGGGMSPLTMLLLGVLAYRTMQGKGRLAEMLRGPLGGTNPAANPVPHPGANPSGSNPGGTYPADVPGANPAGGTGGLGDLLRGGLGGLLAGGAAGGLLSGALGDLVRQFQQNGVGGAANSWVARGPNEAISPDQVEQGLGSDRVNSLAEQAGMPRADVLRHLSEALPETVDQLTPEGRLPTEQEAGRWA